MSKKIEFNKRSIDKEVHVLSLGKRGKIVDVKDEETFLVLVDNGELNEIKEIDIFDIRYV